MPIHVASRRRYQRMNVGVATRTRIKLQQSPDNKFKKR
ncbi:hypothetical protein HCH_02427 [Hahella chejuensis KCTC 2396]|uniref:Uncharacterized protein n=1 Tax=Hahella chejuensis (strain KCTC 2396) TaxID=349521 RepID=Q2SJD9_HAHCH|nr:hypothetical protein HCH_02427 [Hahella chejuensis KCTC 2396]